MLTATTETTETSDAELIAAVRAGDVDAYGELFDRHRAAATRLANQLVRSPDADDLVAESFIRVLTVLQDGRGPDEAFRAYLLTAIRRLHIDRIRAGSKVRPTGDEAELDRAVAFVDPAEMRFERTAASTAFSTLPERWQLVLWHLDVEGQKPADIAPLLGMSANSVSALAYRAREGLRQAYLQGHLAPTLHPGCEQTTQLLGAYVRKGLSTRDATKVERHLDDCSRCAGLQLELAEVNQNLSGVLGPALLGSAFSGYVAAGTGVAGATATAGVGTAVGIKVAAGHAAHLAIAPVKVAGAAIAGAGAQGVVAAAVVTSVATAGTVAVATDFGGRQEPSVSAEIAARADLPVTEPPAVDGSVLPSPTPVPTPEPSAEPTVEPVPPTPTPSPTPEPTTAPSTEPEPEPEPKSSEDDDDRESDTTRSPAETDEPDKKKAAPVEPPPVPIVPTDYGIGAYSISHDDSLLQRRFTIPVTAVNRGRAADQQVTLSIQFRREVEFRGVVSGGWSCGAGRGQVLRTLTCTATLPAGQGATFIAKARGLRPSGTITVSADGDPQPADNVVSFESGPYRGPS